MHHLHWGQRTLEFSGRALVMGVLNCTPDSFYAASRTDGLRAALEHARHMLGAGADILDVGGESSRPGAVSVPVQEEIRRVVPVIDALRRESSVLVSVDTSKPEVAAAAIAAGADMVNDIRGLRDPRMAEVVAEAQVPAVLMHMRGDPETMQSGPSYAAVTAEVLAFLAGAVNAAVAAGVRRNLLIVDPGIGFGKPLQDNLRLLRQLRALNALALPVLIGVSRKSFIGSVLDRDVTDRLAGTIAANTIAVLNGADILRVHDVAAAVDVVRMAAAVGGSS